MLNTRQLQTVRWIAITAIFIAIGLWTWRHDRIATRLAIHGTIICLAIGYFGYIYVRCLAKVVRGNRPRFRITDLFALSTATAFLAASGLGGDSLAFVLLIVYTILCGPLWRRFVSRWTKHDLSTAIWTSAAIVSSFVVVLTGISVLVFVFVPQAFRSCATVYVALYTSLYISFEFIWGDNYDTDAQLILYGLPFGLPLNIAVGLLAGAALGLVAHLLRPPHANE